MLLFHFIIIITFRVDEKKHQIFVNFKLQMTVQRLCQTILLKFVSYMQFTGRSRRQYSSQVCQSIVQMSYQTTDNQKSCQTIAHRSCEETVHRLHQTIVQEFYEKVPQRPYQILGQRSCAMKVHSIMRGLFKDQMRRQFKGYVRHQFRGYVRHQFRGTAVLLKSCFISAELTYKCFISLKNLILK